MPRLESDLWQRQPAVARRPDQLTMCATRPDLSLEFARHALTWSQIAVFLQGPFAQTFLSFDPQSTGNKKADVAESSEGFHHIGLLINPRAAN